MVYNYRHKEAIRARLEAIERVDRCETRKNMHESGLLSNVTRRAITAGATANLRKSATQSLLRRVHLSKRLNVGVSGQNGRKKI